MVSIVTDYIQNTAAHYLKTGLEAGGSIAGNAVGGVGALIESSGRSVGESVSGAVSGVGGYVNSYGDSITGSMAPDGPRVTRNAKPVAKQSSSKPVAVVSRQQAVKRDKPLPVAKQSSRAVASSKISTRTPQPSKTLLSQPSTARKSMPTSNKNILQLKASSLQGQTAAAKSSSSAQQSCNGKVHISDSSKPRPRPRPV